MKHVASFLRFPVQLLCSGQLIQEHLPILLSSFIRSLLSFAEHSYFQSKKREECFDTFNESTKKRKRAVSYVSHNVETRGSCNLTNITLHTTNHLWRRRLCCVGHRITESKKTWIRFCKSSHKWWVVECWACLVWEENFSLVSFFVLIIHTHPPTHPPTHTHTHTHTYSTLWFPKVSCHHSATNSVQLSYGKHYKQTKPTHSMWVHCLKKPICLREED
jgi:hypothetical protein